MWVLITDKTKTALIEFGEKKGVYFRQPDKRNFFSIQSLPISECFIVFVIFFADLAAKFVSVCPEYA